MRTLRRKELTDRYLQKLWREKVLRKHNCQCVLCGKGGEENLQCHHFVRRRKLVLRHDWKNGFPLCHECHLKAHTKLGERKLIQVMGEERYEYLCQMERYTIKDYLLYYGMSRKEWDDLNREDLKLNE